MKILSKLLLLLIIITICSCNNNSESKSEKKYNAYAQFFRLGSDRLTIYNPSGLDSIIFKRSSDPYSKIAIQSTTQLSFLEALNQLDRICAVPYANYLCQQQVISGLEQGRIREILSGDAMNIEFMIIDTIPLMLLGDFADYKRPKIKQLRAFNIETVPILDWKETHPLARAEWIKVLGWLVGKDQLANEIFDSIEQRYNTLCDSIAIEIKDKARPKVFAGLSQKDNWYLPGGKSYLAQLIRDAGGDYLFKKNNDIASFQASFETVFLQLEEASVWIASVNTKSLYEFISLDKRVEKMSIVKQGNIFGNGKRLCAQGGNEYWSDGVIRPDQILQDLYLIFFEDYHNAYFYHKLK